MKHCILAKFKPELGESSKEKLYPEISELFHQLDGMDGIHGVELIRNVTNRPNRYDLLIRIDMDPETLPAYDAGSVHIRWKKEYGEYLEKKAIFDYE